MKKKFDVKLLEPELHELSNLFQADGNMNILFDWFDSSEHDWEYGSQQRFLIWVEKEVRLRTKNFNEDPLSKDTIRKRYQRNQKLSPEQRAFRLNRRERLHDISESNFISDCISRSYNCNYDDDDYEGIYMPESSKKAIRKIFEIIRQKINMIWEKSRQYRLNTTLISAYGIWINSDMFRSPQRLLDAAPFLREIFEDHVQSLLSSIEAADDVKEPSCKSTTIPPARRGSFFVFSGSQMVKEAKTSGKSNERINKMREELINSGIVEAQYQERIGLNRRKVVE